MKKYALVLLSIVFILAACSQKTSLNLVNTKVKIDTNSGENVKSLHYTFTIKNRSLHKKMNWTLMKFKIVPDKKLAYISKEVTGENIFKDQSQWSHEIKCKDNYHCTFSLDRILKSKENTPLSSDQLKKLEDRALNATLVVNEDKKETRFHLSNGQ